MTTQTLRKPDPGVYPQGYVMFDGSPSFVRIDFRQRPGAPYQVLTLDRRSARLLARRINAALESKATR